MFRELSENMPIDFRTQSIRTNDRAGVLTSSL